MHRPYSSVVGPWLIPPVHEVFFRVERPNYAVYRERPAVSGSVQMLCLGAALHLEAHG